MTRNDHLLKTGVDPVKAARDARRQDYYKDLPSFQTKGRKYYTNRSRGPRGEPGSSADNPVPASNEREFKSYK